jgi:hypothetical protein
MKKKGYKSSVPLETPMLTAQHIKIQLAWIQIHMHNDWSCTIFINKTAFNPF